MKRREILAAAAAAPVAGILPHAALADTPRKADWERIAALYDRPPGVIQLEHGNWGAMARPVRQEYLRQVERVNRDTSFYARRAMGADLRTAHRAVAKLLGVETDEVVLTRNATEALKALILGYEALRSGDAMILADHDYDTMQNCMASLAARRGVEVVRIALPHPATHQGLIDAYEAALHAHPRTRLVLLTHLGHRSGLVLPVAEITALARSRGAEVIVDAAHSLGQLDFRLPDLGADFIGVNLHKWIGAPLGVGAMIVRRGRYGEFARDPASDPLRESGIAALVHTGTVDFAAVLTLPAAIAFQDAVGAARRVTRLRALRDRWVAPFEGHPAIDILTPPDPRLYGAITSFRIKGDSSAEGHGKLAARLLDEFGVFTVVRNGLAGGACIRVTPALANLLADCDHLANALQRLLPRGRA